MFVFEAGADPLGFCMFPRQVMALLVGRNRDVLKLKPDSVTEDV
jgi:hypothetical protein